MENIENYLNSFPENVKEINLSYYNLTYLPNIIFLKKTTTKINFFFN
jgi:hypothetical protein